MADLVIFAHMVSIDATAATTALTSEAERRGLTLPERISAPAGRDWPNGYARVARDVPDLHERDLPGALTTVGLFIDPLLTGSAQGRWDPAKLRWGDTPLAFPPQSP